MKDEVIEEIKKIEGVIYSESEKAFATTDKIMEELISKHNITTNEDFAEPEHQDKYSYVEHIYESIEQWIEWHYDEDIELFGKEFYLPDWAECVRIDHSNWKTDEFLFETDDWAKELYSSLIKEVSCGMQIHLEEELNKAVDAGYSLKIIKDAFDNAQFRIDYMKNKFNVMNYDNEKQEKGLVTKGSYVSIGSYYDVKDAIKHWYEIKADKEFVAAYIEYNGKIVFNGISNDFDEVLIEDAEKEIMKNM
jgi:hypothetical protein